MRTMFLLLAIASICFVSCNDSEEESPAVRRMKAKIDSMIAADTNKVKDDSADSEVDYNYTPQTSEDRIYTMIETAFEGYPSRSEVEPMMEKVLKRYDYEVTPRNIEKTASMLVSLRKNSAVGVTEMEILKHIYQNGSSSNTLPDQAGLSATILERTK